MPSLTLKQAQPSRGEDCYVLLLVIKCIYGEGRRAYYILQRIV